MIADKSELLIVMNSIIQENSSKEKQWSVDLSLLQKAMENAGDSANKTFPPLLKTSELMKLEERIEKLEELNEKLLCIVHFLFEKILGVTKNLFETAPNESGKLKCEVCETATGKGTINFCGSTEKKKPSLTKREMDIFNLLAKGLCAKEIAKILFISETTVITQKRNLKEKFHAKNTVELISNVLSKKIN